MKFALQICIFAATLCIIAAYWIDPADMDDNDVLSAFRTVKRKACASYSMICLPDSEYAFAKCCPGLSCFCNLWQTHCKCRVKLG